jgi:DNA-binding MarR family transcriptional regulator
MTTPRARISRPQPRGPRKADYVTLARFRSALRGFLRFVEAGARAAGITPQQHQLLLYLRGRPDREWATVGEIADEFHLRHHSAVELTKRCAAAGIVRRSADPDDRRRVRIEATALGRRTLARLTRRNRRELPGLRRMLDQAVRPGRKDAF